MLNEVIWKCFVSFVAAAPEEFDDIYTETHLDMDRIP